MQVGIKGPKGLSYSDRESRRQTHKIAVQSHLDTVNFNKIEMLRTWTYIDRLRIHHFMPLYRLVNGSFSVLLGLKCVKMSKNGKRSVDHRSARLYWRGSLCNALVRAGVEATVSELTRAHGARASRHRKAVRTRLQIIFAAMACNVKRFIRYSRQCICPALDMG